MELNAEELRHNIEKAGACLDRQRDGVDSRTSSDGSGTEKNDGVLLGPKTGGVIVGPPWDGEDVEMEVGKGLIECTGGMKYICEYETCSENWSTRVLPVEQATALVKMYEMHVIQCHDKKKSSKEEEKYDRDQENYKEVVKERKIAACVDNRVDKLAPARFLPLPLQYQHIAKNQPPQQTPVYERLDLAHLGLHLADTSIVAKLHNRAYGATRLRDFLIINLGVEEEDKDLVFKPQKKGGAWTQTKNVKYVQTIEEAVLALLNCDCIWRFLHPCDYGTLAIVRFLIHKIHHPNADRRLTSVQAICAFFQAAMKGNADRVMGPEHPRTYQELVNFFNSMDWSSGAPSSFGSPGDKLGEKKELGYAGKRSSSSQVGGEKKKSRDICFAFNSAKGCQRANGDSCHKGGRQFLHICSLEGKNGSICGSKEHGRMQHP